RGPPPPGGRALAVRLLRGRDDHRRGPHPGRPVPRRPPPRPRPAPPPVPPGPPRRGVGGSSPPTFFLAAGPCPPGIPPRAVGPQPHGAGPGQVRVRARRVRGWAAAPGPAGARRSGGGPCP